MHRQADGLNADLFSSDGGCVAVPRGLGASLHQPQSKEWLSKILVPHGVQRWGSSPPAEDFRGFLTTIDWCAAHLDGLYGARINVGAVNTPEGIVSIGSFGAFESALLPR
ncbi:MAG: hypothetical protein AAF771_06270 [Pseudomonadota bacterium]